jgi:hypothetical protein
MSAAGVARVDESRYGKRTAARSGPAQFIAIIGEVDAIEARGHIHSWPDGGTNVLLLETWNHRIVISAGLAGFADGLVIDGIGYMRMPGGFKVWHPFGEEGGTPPSLRRLPSGLWALEGGTYFVAPEGIRN